MSDPLRPHDAEEVLRRAAELSTPRTPAGAGLDRDAITAAAEEAGMDPAAVGRALAEYDAGLLDTTPPDGGLLGPAGVLVTRTVPLGESTARARVQQWLKRQVLEPSERSGAVETWRRRDDLVAKLRRRFDPTRSVRLGNVDAIRSSCTAAGDGRTLVRLEADLQAMRRGLLTGVVAVPATVTPLLGAVGAVVTGEILFAAGSVPLGLALGGLGITAARRTLTTERDEARRVLGMFLDELEGR